MYGSFVGTVSNIDSLTPKFKARMDLGVCVIQSSTLNVVLWRFSRFSIGWHERLYPVASKFPTSMSTSGPGPQMGDQTIIKRQKILILVIEALRNQKHCSLSGYQEQYLVSCVPALLENTIYHLLASRRLDSSQSRLQQRPERIRSKRSPIPPEIRSVKRLLP